MPSEDEYLNYYRKSHTGNVSTLDEESIPTGLSFAMQELGIEIHSITTYMPLPEDAPAAASVELTQSALSGETGLTATPTISDNPTLYFREYGLGAGVATYLPIYIYDQGHAGHVDFLKPRLYAFPDLYTYIDSTNSSANPRCDWLIGFMFVDLGTQGYYEVLQSYIQLWG